MALPYGNNSFISINTKLLFSYVPGKKGALSLKGRYRAVVDLAVKALGY